jgi:hypothetical protein
MYTVVKILARVTESIQLRRMQKMLEHFGQGVFLNSTTVQSTRRIIKAAYVPNRVSRFSTFLNFQKE